MNYWTEYYRNNKEKINQTKKALDMKKLEYLCSKGEITPFALNFIKKTRK
jgi:hypothetical protein